MDVTQPGVQDGLFRTYSNRFQDAFSTTQPRWMEIAMEENSNSSETVYSLTAKRARLQEWIGERQLRGMASRSYTVGNKRYEDSLELDIDMIEDDAFGIFNARTDELGQAAKLWPDELVFPALMAGNSTLCVDGKNFFASDHPITPFNTDLGTWSNIYTGKPFNEENFSEVHMNGRLVLGWDERVMKIYFDTFIGPPQLEDIAKKTLMNPMVSSITSNGPNGVPVQNIQAGKVKKLIILEELADEPNVWYLAKTIGPEKPLIFQVRKAPMFEEISKPGSELIVLRRKIIYSVFARGGVGYYLPHFAVRCEG